jgi:hypothetical protein
MHSSEENINKIQPNKIKPNIESFNIGSPKSPISEDPRSPGYKTPDVNEANQLNKPNEETYKFTKPNLRIRIPSENRSKIIKYTRNKYLDENATDESYSLFCRY